MDWDWAYRRYKPGGLIVGFQDSTGKFCQACDVLLSWPDALKALPKSLPDSSGKSTRRGSMEGPWYLERGFTLGHAGYFALRPPMGRRAGWPCE